MDLYGQAPDVRLLTALLGEVRHKVVIDVGAERGNFSAVLRDAGAEHVFAIEPAPQNVEVLERRFADDPLVDVLAMALSSADGQLELHTSVAPDGSPVSYGHTVLSRPDTDEIGWGETISVAARTLKTLVDEQVIPGEVGILKIDTEGHDLDVLKGMGKLQPEVVMVEHWLDLPRSLGACPWTMDDLRAELEPRGFHHFAFVVHRGEFVILQWDDEAISSDHMGNVVFLHDDVLAASLQHILSTASALTSAAVELGEARATAADERLVVIAQLEREREVQTQATAERLTLVGELSRELEADSSQTDLPTTKQHRTSLMRPDKQLFLAGLVREHLTQLDEVLAEVLERHEPLSTLETRLLLDSAVARLEPVEHELRRSSRTVSGRAWATARRVKARTRAWLAPRISLLYHYPPKPILLPTSYFHTRAPEPAPSIAVVTPSYQQGRFLERTMLSVLAQKYPALEYYVQDGGSTDDSTEILGHYEEYLTGWASAPDKGQADAINRAFAHTSGEIMGWLNSDDLLLPGALAYVARFFDEHPKVDVVYGNRLMIDENDGQVGAWILPRHSDHALRFADYVPQETLFWRRRIWEASGSELDLSFSYALDWDLLLRFQAAGARTVHVPRFLGAFRVHDNQKTSATALVGLEEMSLLRERVHGRLVPADELPRRLRPYFVHHRVIHAWHRVLDRLPLSRGSVNTDPDAYLHDFPVAASVRSAAPALSSRSPAGEPPASGPS